MTEILRALTNFTDEFLVIFGSLSLIILCLYVSYLLYSRKKSKDVFISHVIFSMILNNKMFTHTSANKYIDWGTLREFRNWQKNYTTNQISSLM